MSVPRPAKPPVGRDNVHEMEYVFEVLGKQGRLGTLRLPERLLCGMRDVSGLRMRLMTMDWIKCQVRELKQPAKPVRPQKSGQK